MQNPEKLPISVIIPTYNRLQLLKETLDSIPERDDMEIIVVDDGSTDLTVEFLQSQSHIKIVKQNNKGPAIARNAAAKIARGEYLAFLDSDDLWFPWTPDVYLQVIEEMGAAFIAGKPYSFKDTRELNQLEGSTVHANTFSDYLASGDVWRWWGCSSFLIKKTAFEEVGGFCNKWINAEDADLALRLCTAQGFVQITQPYTFGYREHAVSEVQKHDKSLEGIQHLLDAFFAGDYPGKEKRFREQAKIVSRHVRPVILSVLQSGNRSKAWELYKETFWMHVRLFRFKFLAGFLWRTILC